VNHPDTPTDLRASESAPACLTAGMAPTAAAEAPDEPAAAPETYRDPEAVLEDLLREVQHIARNQEYEEFSIWNIFGGLVQCFVFFLLFWTYFRGQTQDLLWAVVLQLTALTFFVLAKK
jgi:hypothetical protein